jgi:DNA-directed RNA polymerase subunit beta'
MKGIQPDLVNTTMTKKTIGKMIDEVYRLCGQKARLSSVTR